VPTQRGRPPNPRKHPGLSDIASCVTGRCSIGLTSAGASKTFGPAERSSSRPSSSTISCHPRSDASHPGLADLDGRPADRRAPWSARRGHARRAPGTGRRSWRVTSSSWTRSRSRLASLP